MSDGSTLDKNTLLLYNAAQKLKLHPELLLDEVHGFRVSLGPNYYHFRMADTPFNTAIAAAICRNKYCVNNLLARAGLPVPKSIPIARSQFSQQIVDDVVAILGLPVVIKPTFDTSKGKLVLCNINDKQLLFDSLKNAFKQERKLMTVEVYHAGLRSFRVHVFNNRIAGVVERTPAHVIGDGKHTIAQLIDMANIERAKLKDKLSLGQMNKADPEYGIRLDELGLSLDSVPKQDEYIQLCYVCNSTRGGTMCSLGKEHIDFDNAELLKKASRVLGLTSVGFDVLCEDILKPYHASQFLIIEANENADFTIHENAMYGIKNPISTTIMRQLIKKHPFDYLQNIIRHASPTLRALARIAAFLLVSFSLAHVILR